MYEAPATFSSRMGDAGGGAPASSHAALTRTMSASPAIVHPAFARSPFLNILPPDTASRLRRSVDDHLATVVFTSMDTASDASAPGLLIGRGGELLNGISRVSTKGAVSDVSGAPHHSACIHRPQPDTHAIRRDAGSATELERTVVGEPVCTVRLMLLGATPVVLDRGEITGNPRQTRGRQQRNRPASRAFIKDLPLHQASRFVSEHAFGRPSVRGRGGLRDRRVSVNRQALADDLRHGIKTSLCECKKACHALGRSSYPTAVDRRRSFGSVCTRTSSGPRAHSPSERQSTSTMKTRSESSSPPAPRSIRSRGSLRPHRFSDQNRRSSRNRRDAS